MYRVLAFIAIVATTKVDGALNLLGTPSPLNCATGTLSCVTQLLNGLNNANPDVQLSIPQLLQKYGYVVQQLNVPTQDGYILGVYRTYNATCGDPTDLVPVILNHGLLSNGYTFLTQYGDGNLAMLLADACFDVYINNARGTSYSMGNTNPDLDPSNAAYWNFSFHEMGVYDVPAVMAAVTATNGNSRMFYVGHSQGTTEFMVAMSQKPELNANIIEAFLLSPVANIAHSTNLLIKSLSPLLQYSQPFLNLTGGKVDQLTQLQNLVGPLGAFCSPSLAACSGCSNAIFLLFGFDNYQVNYTSVGMIPKIIDNISTKTLVHFAQMHSQANFCQFNYTTSALNQENYGQPNPPCYDMSEIVAPMVLYWGENDNLVVPEDVDITRSQLPSSSIQAFTKVDFSCWTHLDFATAKDAKKLVYNDIKSRMLAFTSG